VGEASDAARHRLGARAPRRARELERGGTRSLGRLRGVPPDIAMRRIREVDRAAGGIRGVLRRAGEGVSGLAELAQMHEGETLQLLQPAATRARDRGAEAPRDRERLLAVPDHAAARVALRGLLRGALVVVERARPVLGALEVVRQRLVVLPQ